MMRLVLYSLILAAHFSLPLQAAPRTWTSADGSRKVEAELVESRDGKVTLRRNDGRTVTVDIGSLSAEDQDFIAKQEDEVEARDADSPPTNESGIRVEFIGLEVGRARPTVPEDEEEDGFDIPEGIEGTLLRFWLHAPNRKMIAIDDELSKVVSMVDDKGTTFAASQDDRPAKGFGLLGKLRKQMSDTSMSFYPSAHMRTGDLEISVPTCPAPGAREIRLEASIVVKCGSGEVRDEARDVTLATGSTFTTGDIAWEVKRAEPFAQMGMKMRATLVTDFPYESLASLECLDEDGEPIDTIEPAIIPGAGKVQVYLMMPEEMKTIGFRATYFKKLETVTVPIKLTTGVGW